MAFELFLKELLTISRRIKKVFVYLQPNRKDMKRIVKWFIWILTIVALLYVGTGLLLFYHVCTTDVYETPWGKILPELVFLNTGDMNHAMRPAEK